MAHKQSRTSADELEIIFRRAKHIKPKHNLSAEEMDELNEKLFH